jgi:predicted extracellular nuclease
MRTSLLPCLVLGLLVSACINPQKKDDDTDDTSDTTIFDLQQGEVAEDSVVTLKDVLVSTPLTIEGDGFFIQDPAGGEYSGIYVFLQGSFSDLFLSVGDQITVTGAYTEYYDFSELTVTSETAIQVTGYDELTATVVSDVADWEPYESVLVTLEDQAIEDCTNQYGEVGLSEGIQMDDAFFSFDADKGATYESITGAIAYNFGEFKLWPRDAEDLSGGTDGEGCTSTIHAIQSEGIEGGVELENVVVTSGMTYEGEGFFVQDQGGGEYTGIYVYTAYLDKGAIDPQVGDLINLAGSVTEYYDLTELVLDNAENYEVIGSADPVATELNEAPADWEPYEGCLVTLSNLGVTSDDGGYGEYDTDYDIQLSDLFFNAGAENGTTYDALSGLVSYSYGEFLIGPRDSDDLSGEGSGDPVDEPSEDATISDVQTGAYSEGDSVTLEGVIATTQSDGDGFFVQDVGGGEYSGIYVYGSSTEVSVGDELTITGEVTEYYDFTEIVVGSDSDISITGSGSATSTTLSEAPADWEVYEGVLIRVEDISLTSEADEYGQCDTSWDGLTLDDLLYDYYDDYFSGDSFEHITGALGYGYSAWRLYSRDASDFE